MFPIGAGIWLACIPRIAIKTPYTSWQFDATTTRMPEFTAPGLGRESNHVDDRCRSWAKMLPGCCMPSAARRGGLTLYMDNGQLVYEYNMMIIERYVARSNEQTRRWQAPASRSIPRSRSPAHLRTSF